MKPMGDGHGSIGLFQARFFVRLGFFIRIQGWRNYKKIWHSGNVLLYDICPILGTLSIFTTQRFFYFIFFANTRIAKKKFTRLFYKRVNESPQKLVRRNAPCNRTCPKSFNSIEQSNPLCPTLGECPGVTWWLLFPKWDRCPKVGHSPTVIFS